MGSFQHKALVVIFGDWHGTYGADLYRMATAMCPGVVTPILDVVNQYRTFAVLPKGSKDGWTPALEHETALEKLYAFAKSKSIEASYVSFGEYGAAMRYTREDELDD